MSKKMLKRSLALGALMAFVITGSAMAAEGNYKVFEDQQEIISDEVSYNLSSGKYGFGMYAANSTVTFNNNVTSGAKISGEVTSQEFWDNGYGAYGVTVQGVQGKTTTLTFAGNTTNISAVGNYAVGIQASHGNDSKVSFNSKETTINVSYDGNASEGRLEGIQAQYDTLVESSADSNVVINVTAGENVAADLDAIGIYAGEYENGTGKVNLMGSLNATVINKGAVGNAYGVYGEAGADIDLADTTITATSEEGRAYGVWVDESTINIADTTITATSENSRAVGIAAANSGNEVYVDGDITINATAGERADGMNLDNATVNVTGKLTIDATGKTDVYNIGSQGVRLAESTAQFADVDISVKSTTDGTVYGIRMLGDNNTTSTQLDISGNADVYAETDGVAYGIIVSTGANVDLKDDISDVGNNLAVTVKGKEEASAIRAQYGSDINVSANTDVDIVATSESGKAYGVVNSYLTYDSVNYAKAKANISILGNVNIEANGKTGSYAVYNSTDYNKEDAEDVGNTIIGGEGKKVTITGDMYANSGSIITTFGAEGSQFDGKVETVEKGTTTLNFAKGATWNLSDASTLTNATFDASSVLNIDGTKYTGADYALNASEGDTSLTVEQGAVLAIKGIEEGTTYNIAQGFNVAKTEGEKWTIDNNLLTGTWTDTKGLQVTTKAKDAGQIAEDMGVDSGTASALGSIINAANSDSVPDTEAAQNVVKFAQEIASASPEVAAAAAEAVIKMAEAGGNSATAASIVKNVTGVTNDRLSFNCGHSAPHKGGHGVGLLEEGSGADIWVEYVHGKDEVEDMPSTAGASSYEGQYNGFVMGLDFKKVNKFQSGIAFNYGEGDTNSVATTSRTHSDYDFWGIGYYGSIYNDDSNVIFDINYAKSDSDVTNRNLAAVYEASPETTTWTAGVKVEKLYQNNNVQIVPYTGLRYMSIDSDDYATKCGTFNYKMDRQDIWLLPVGVSIKQEVTNDNGWTVSPRVDLSYIWAFGDTDSNMEFATALNTKTNIGYDVMDDGSFLGLVGIEAHKGQWGYGVAYSYQKGDHSESKKWYVDVNYSF